MKYFIIILLYIGIQPIIKADSPYSSHAWWDHEYVMPFAEADLIEKGVIVDGYYKIEYPLWDHKFDDYFEISKDHKCIASYIYYIISPEKNEAAVSEPFYGGFGDCRGGGNWQDADVKIPESIDIDGITYTIVSIENGPANAARSIEIPSTVRHIKSNSYSNYRINRYIEKSYCSAEFIFNEGLETIMDHVFYTADIKELSFPSSLRYIGSEVCVDCQYLEKVEFNEGLSSIGYFSFSKCPMLREIELPSTLQSLGRGSFNSCENLERIHLSRWIRNVNGFEEICNDCPNIKEIQYDSRTPWPATNSFNKVNKEECILRVPYQSAWRYAMLDGWKDFKNIVEMDESPDVINPSSVNTIGEDTETGDTGYYTTDGIRYDEWNSIPSGTLILHKGQKIFKR